jgi:lipopolysaccharide biosynthesis regulator YciM
MPTTPNRPKTHEFPKDAIKASDPIEDIIQRIKEWRKSINSAENIVRTGNDEK